MPETVRSALEASKTAGGDTRPTKTTRRRHGNARNGPGHLESIRNGPGALSEHTKRSGVKSEASKMTWG